MRVAWHQAIRTASPSRVDVNLVGSYQLAEGLRAVLDLGAQVGIPALRGTEAPVRVLGTYSAGLAYPVIPDELQLSLESLGEFAVRGLDRSRTSSSARTWRGRSAGGGSPGYSGGPDAAVPETPRFMPRLIWAVAL